MSLQGLENLLSPSDVADLAGVSRPVVSNWRKRHKDFPAAVAGSDAKPLFQRRAVIEWLRERGHKAEGEAAGGRIWSALNAVRGRVPLDDAAGLVLLLATVKRTRPAGFEQIVRTQPAEQGERLLEELVELRRLPGLRELRGPSPELVGLQPSLSLIVESVAQTHPDDLADSVDAVLERFSRSQIKAGAESGFIGSRTSALLSSLAGDTAGSVYDPACGIANALIRIATRGYATQLTGSEINPGALMVAAERALLHGVRIDLLPGDVLKRDPDPDLRADVVIAEPPFGMSWDQSLAMADPRFSFGVPPRAAADLAWVQHVIAHLASEGRGYVLTAPGALFRGGAERQIRANLLSAGCVEAVVALPPKMLPHTSIGPSLWVLRPRSEPGDVLLIDAADTDVDQVSSTVASWLNRDQGTRAKPDAPHVMTSVVDLVAADAVLSPAKWVAEQSIDRSSIAASFARASSGLPDTIRLVAGSLPVFDQVADLPGARVATVRELIDNGAVELQLGRPDKARDLDRDLTARIVRAGDVKRRVLPPTDGPDRAASELTQPGDVLVTTMNEVRAVVDRTGGHLGSTGVDRLRIADEALISPGYLAAVLAGTWNARLQAGSTIQRAPIRDLEVPLIPIRDQDRVTRALDELRAVRDLSSRLDAQARDAYDSILEALRYNAQLSSPESSQPFDQQLVPGRGHDASKQSEGTE